MAEQANITKLAYGSNNESFTHLTSWHIKYVYLELENHSIFAINNNKKDFNQNPCFKQMKIYHQTLRK